MFQERTGLPKPMRWVVDALGRSSDLVAIGGGMLGLVLIVAIVIVGLHERQISFRATAPTEYSQDN
jgi:hypothetical protein